MLTSPSSSPLGVVCTDIASSFLLFEYLHLCLLLLCGDGIYLAFFRSRDLEHVTAEHEDACSDMLCHDRLTYNTLLIMIFIHDKVPRGCTTKESALATTLYTLVQVHARPTSRSRSRPCVRYTTKPTQPPGNLPLAPAS
jgi:hypothetical protein